jgi:cell division protein FtsB
LISS